MSFVLKLPEAVCVDVLSQWCTLKDISCLDSAFCNKTERKDLLQLFQHRGFVTHSAKIPICHMLYLKDRRIKMSTLGGLDICWRTNLLLKIDRSQVVTLNFEFNYVDTHQGLPVMNKSWFHNFLKPMKLLVSLKLFFKKPEQLLYGGVVWVTLSELNRLAQLTHIELYSDNTLSDADVTLLATHCRHLQYLSITNNSKVSENTMIELLSKNQKLRHLTLSFMPLITGAILPLLAKCCKSLEHLELLIAHQFNWAEVVNLLTECVHLHFCVVGRNRSFTLSNKKNRKNVKVLTLVQDKNAVLLGESDLYHLLSVVRGCDEVCVQHVQSLSRRCLEMISNNNPQLKTQLLCNAPTITADDLISLVEHCPLLKDLRVQDCEGVNREQLMEKAAVSKIALSWW